jgi:hypothetical protein
MKLSVVLVVRNTGVAWLLCALAAAPAFAEGSASSASSATSSAAGSASNSLQGSSNSSSQNPTPRAGDYRIETIAAASDRPGMVRLALQPAGEGGPRDGFVLVLPQRTVDEQALVRGDMLSVRERAYGFEFARARTGQAFFLVLADAWHHELDARPVNPTRL